MDAETSTQRFGPSGRYELQALERRRLVDGQPARLGARAFDLQQQGAVIVDPANLPTVLETDRERNVLAWQICEKAKGQDATARWCSSTASSATSTAGCNRSDPRHR
jgi:hypothetical protein